MRLEDLDYDLPPELIAQQPIEDRAGSRMLHLDRSTGAVHHRAFRDCVDLLRPGDLLVLNDTRVSAARLYATKPTGGKVEVLVLRDLGSGEYEALAKPAKTLREETLLDFGAGLFGSVAKNLGEGLIRIRFDSAPKLAEAMSHSASVPLPSYIRSGIDDPRRYQTVYAAAPGSAAAPTAGLHFTDALLKTIQAKGVRLATVTLDVGLDTFRPMATSPEIHPMHGERCELSSATAEAIAECSGRIVAVGTTTVRTIESFAVGPRRVEPGNHVTKMLISPGYRFKVVDGMFTNFHLPRTTMLLMLWALAGADAVRAAYREAVHEKYRFLSFGDSMLIL